jgi:hypothetical protein
MSSQQGWVFTRIGDTQLGQPVTLHGVSGVPTLGRRHQRHRSAAGTHPRRPLPAAPPRHHQHISTPNWPSTKSHADRGSHPRWSTPPAAVAEQRPQRAARAPRRSRPNPPPPEPKIVVLAAPQHRRPQGGRSGHWRAATAPTTQTTRGPPPRRLREAATKARPPPDPGFAVPAAPRHRKAPGKAEPVASKWIRRGHGRIRPPEPKKSPPWPPSKSTRGEESEGSGGAPPPLSLRPHGHPVAARAAAREGAAPPPGLGFHPGSPGGATRALRAECWFFRVC